MLACILAVYVVFALSILFLMKRNSAVSQARRHAIAVVFDVTDAWKSLHPYLDKSTYDQQVWQFSKWTFEDFFPELATIEQERNSK